MMTLRRPPRRGFGEQPATLAAIQNLFAWGELGGYWPADPQYAYEDSAGTTLASVNGVVGYRADVACGKHAIQATTADKPYLRRTPATGKYWYDSNTATGALTATFSGSIGSSCTIATVTPEGVSILENQTVGATYNISPPYGYNSDVLIINRALTSAEKALVTRVMGRNVPMLGSELVTNGGFDVDASGWTAIRSATLSVANGKLTATAISNHNSGILQSVASSSEYAVLRFNYSNKSEAGLIYVRFSDSGGPVESGSSVDVASGKTYTSFGDYKIMTKTISNKPWLLFFTYSTINSAFTIDNISLRMVI